MKWLCVCAVMAAIAWAALGCDETGTFVPSDDTAAVRAGADNVPGSAVQQQDRERLQEGSCDEAACQDCDRDRDRDRLQDGSCATRGIQVQDRDRDECGDCEGPCTKSRLGIGA
ncbi:MAG TPA: hypothetical protein PLD23_19105 [Armatimonadota bacterium]|nr:hypothetical protein [Armatimonadota bacterium]